MTFMIGLCVLVRVGPQGSERWLAMRGFARWREWVRSFVVRCSRIVCANEVPEIAVPLCGLQRAPMAHAAGPENAGL
jgi:hypothetical protein